MNRHLISFYFFVWPVGDKMRRGDGKMEIYKTVSEIDIEKEILREKRIKALEYSFISPQYREYLRKRINE
ncbi:MAG: hypothetical protein QIT35_gp64 [Methanophagales virus PBV299]|uniref:Uncharacterized protein n=1 Tax=Methanophagales virus PBV299 TaxID=2987730 RepID=A0ABY6GND7_9CAUD|nr:MAG: hypothetical protein QIT35_gp64 [Methanophagales virus PBV299]UYL64860.1 MAG: hypothetical protein OFDIEDLO_00064 [Methanophagales virus PBV299]